MTKDQALKDYATCLQTIRDLNEAHDKKVADLVTKRMKIEAWLIGNTNEDVDTLPQVVEDERPFVAWTLKPKTDATVAMAYRQMRDVLKPRVENAAKEVVDDLKAGMEVLENYALKQLNERGANNFNTDYATVSRTKVTTYKIADKSLFIKDAIENGYASEVTVSIARNSKFMSTMAEERGELPAGVSSSSFYEARFSKGKA